jgi:hypothetical protein
MPEQDQAPSRPPDSTEIAQAIPKGATRSYDEMNTGQMVFELQGTVHELKEAIASLSRNVEIGFSRIDRIEKASSDIRESLRLLVPKIDDFVGFAKHRAPSLADKADLVTLKADLKLEIEKRPTRRQMVTDIALIVGLVTAAVTFGARTGH